MQRQISSSTKSSFLGYGWLFLSPLMMVLLYTLIFSQVIGLRFRETDSVTNFGLYLFCGLIPFLAYADSLNQSVTSIRSNSTLVQKVVFPVEILPLSLTVTALLTQLFGFAALVPIMLALGNPVHWTMAFLPLLLVPQLLFMLGLGYIGAVVGTYLPDIKETLRAIVRASFFATPIIWPAQRAYDNGMGFLVDYNPLAILVESYRNVVLDGHLPGLTPLLGFTSFSAVLCLFGYLLFVLTKKRFGDLI